MTIPTEAELVEQVAQEINKLFMFGDMTKAELAAHKVIPLVREAEREDCANRVLHAPPGSLRTREAIAVIIRSDQGGDRE